MFETRPLAAVWSACSALVMVVLVAAVCIPRLARATDPQDAAALLAQAKQASGGAAWDDVHSLYMSAKLETAGLSGKAETWQDVLTGRYLQRYDLGPAHGSEGFDGKMLWSTDTSDQPRPEEGGDERAGAADESYRVALAFWYPARHAAEIKSLGSKSDGGRSFDVVEITPQGGRPFEMWLDPQTKLVDRTIEQKATETTTTLFSDYRDVKGCKLPFAIRVTNGEEKYDQHLTMESIELNAALPAEGFAMPAPPPPDFEFAAGKTSTTVPFELLNNHIYLEVSLDGKGPYRLLCDTGGANIVTPTLANALGLKPQGALQGRGVGEKSEDVGLVKMAATSIGDVTLRDQLFAVFPLETFSDVEGATIQGLIGYEVFKRFTVGIDYAASKLTLTLPAAFHDESKGTVVPFVFNEHIPQVEGSIDGIAGKFDIDTGSRASVTILAPFAKQHDLKEKLGATMEAVTGWGVGGPARAQLARAHELHLGAVVVKEPVTELSVQSKGAFSDPYVAGNVGAGVLKRFNIVFDYQNKRLIFAPNSLNDTPDVFDRSGMWINHKENALLVVDVTPTGPADAAGLKAGDKIVAVDGKPVGQTTLLALRNRFRTQKPGTVVRLSVAGPDAAQAPREVRLVLKDLV